MRDNRKYTRSDKNYTDETQQQDNSVTCHPAEVTFPPLPQQRWYLT